MKMCKDEPERRQRSLQQGSEAGSDVLLAPKHQSIVETKREHSTGCKQNPVATCSRQWNTANADYQEEDRAGDNESVARESDWRQVSQTELNKEPGRAPDTAKD